MGTGGGAWLAENKLSPVGVSGTASSRMEGLVAGIGPGLVVWPQGRRGRGLGEPLGGYGRSQLRGRIIVGQMWAEPSVGWPEEGCLSEPAVGVVVGGVFW